MICNLSVFGVTALQIKLDWSAETSSGNVYLCSNKWLPEYFFLFSRNVHSRSAGRPTIHLLKEQGNSLVKLINVPVHNW